VLVLPVVTVTDLSVAEPSAILQKIASPGQVALLIAWFQPVGWLIAGLVFAPAPTMATSRWPGVGEALKVPATLVTDVPCASLWADWTTGAAMVGVAVGVKVNVAVGVLVFVAVGVFVRVAVGGTGVFVGVFVRVGVCVGVLVGVDVGGTGVFVGVCVGVFVRVGVFVGPVVFVGVFVAAGLALNATRSISHVPECAAVAAAEMLPVDGSM
jgi:hypothetical protein